MKVWTRRVVAAIATGLLVVGTVGCAKGTGGSDESKDGAKEPIRVGAVLSLTGTYAGLGESEKKAIELEIERINASGGINGRDLEVLIEDDATDEAKAVAAATKLIEQEEVIAIIGATGTGQTMAMRGELQRAGVPQLSMAGGTVVTGQFDSLVFQTPWSNTIVVPFVLDEIKSAGHKRIALLSDTGGYGKDGREVILREAEKAGIDITIDQSFNPGDNDISTQLVNIKASDAQAILLWTAGKEAATAVKNAGDLGVELPLYGGSGQARLEFIEGAGPAAEGFVFGTGKSLIADNWGEGTDQYAAVADFSARYEDAYGEKPDIFAGHAYDAVTILADALERGGEDVDSAGLRDAIEATSGLAGFGGTFSFSPSNHNGLTTEDLALYRVEGGKWIAAK